MIVGLKYLHVFCSKTNGQSYSMLFIVQVSLVTLWCQQKQSMTEGWMDGLTMDEMILTLDFSDTK